MRSYIAALFTGLVAIAGITSCSKDDDRNNDYQPIEGKKGILLVTFGSSYGYYDGEESSPYSYQKPKDTYDNILKEFKKAYPDEDIRMAYTSSIILNKLRKDGKANLDFPNEALKSMAKEGFSEITVQSLHIIPGAEFNEMNALVNEFKAEFPKVKVKIGNPLLSNSTDIQNIANFLIAKYKAALEKNQAVVLMGHGNEKYPQYNAFYEKLQELIAKTKPEYNLYIGTVEGAPTLNDVLAKLKAKSIAENKIILAPLMSIAGDHANNDMASTNPESWKSVLEEAGFKVTPELIGLGAYNEVVKVWITHKSAAL